MEQFKLGNAEKSCATKNRRGKPPKPFSAQKRVHISLRLTWNQYNQLKEEAQASRLSLSEFIRTKLFRSFDSRAN
ncbi:MAG: hypothetical protein QW660_04105 [Candidatus Bathyarchaeia archaeon]